VSGALADLARAGYRVLDEPSMQVVLQVRHRVDRPGGLAAALDDLPDRTGFDELLCVGGHGVGVVAGTRTGDHGEVGPLRRGALDPGVEAVFHGADLPNLAFRQDFPDRLEGIVVIEDEPKKMLLRHGLAVLDTLTHLAATARAAGDLPLLSLQCPAQLPPTNTYRDGGDTGGRAGEAARSSSLAVRFAMALPGPGAAQRLPVAERIAAYCTEHGLGLWLRDTRPGFRAGNWFSVLRHNRPQARRRYRRAADRARSTGNAAEGCIPVTLVGPARPGSTLAVLRFLGQFPEIGVIGATMLPLGGLAFLTLQLTVIGASKARLFAINGVLEGGGDPERVLRGLVPHLLREGEPAHAHAEHLGSRARDHRIAVGPALPVLADNVVRRVSIWVSWRLPAGPDRGADLREVVLALQEALDALNLVDGREVPAVEYLVCRSGSGRVRGKGKIAVGRNAADRRYPDRTDTLCAELVEAWSRALDRRRGRAVKPGELAASEFESRLG
jgi:hypothetical protein